jgi:hypothetical protein
LRRHVEIVGLLLIAVIALIPSVSASSTQPAKYWFQVGAIASDPQAQFATGASVEIDVRPEQAQGAFRYYWVGLSFPNDSFVQVGYALRPHETTTRWFWAYFPPGAAVEGSNYVIKFGSTPIQVGWTKFSISSSGTTWFLYVNQERVGQVATHARDSGENPPGAIAEDAGTTSVNNQLGPVQFRNLEYKSADGSWHSVKVASAIVGYGAIGARLTEGARFPYGIRFEPGTDNYWIAGSNLPSNLTSAQDGEILWPWSRVQINAPYGYEIENPQSGYENGWYQYGSQVVVAVPQIKNVRSGERALFSGWQTNDPSAHSAYSDSTYAGNRIAPFTVKQPLEITASYTTEYKLTVDSPLGNPQGSGWFKEGSNATFQIQPTVISRTDLWGMLGATNAFAGWTGDYQGANAQASVTMNAPKTITATWTTGFKMTVIDWLITLVLAAVAVAILIVRRRT